MIEKFEVHIEYLHWSNCGKWDGFIDHYNNMINHLIFTGLKNKTVTKLASFLFKIHNDYLPESSYNSQRNT